MLSVYMYKNEVHRANKKATKEKETGKQVTNNNINNKT